MTFENIHILNMNNLNIHGNLYNRLYKKKLEFILKVKSLVLLV